MSDAVVVALIAFLSTLTGAGIQAWFNRRKINSDAYSAIVDALLKSSDALGKSGQTIEGFLEMLAELPQLKSQLRVAQDRITIIERQSAFWLSLSRTLHTGAQANADYIKKLEHVPPFEPGKFPTGPLSAGVIA